MIRQCPISDLPGVMIISTIRVATSDLVKVFFILLLTDLIENSMLINNLRKREGART